MTEKEEIEAILDIFTLDGWKYIMEDINKHYDAINKIDGLSNEKELFYLKGELAKLDWFKSFPDWYQHALDSLER